uniref:Major facilitator superfamily (MFS) profile domain-containing protein n=1 Tax=Anopheles melas TaxID=34690 RepID=A0A182UAJ8_9DIPT
MVVNGFINVVITTIERRFGLRSTQTGLVASGYDIASFLCLVPVSYFGGRLGASKPRWIGWGVAVMGLGAFVFALPHFLVGQYRATNSDQNVCTLATALVTNGTGASVEALTEVGSVIGKNVMGNGVLLCSANHGVRLVQQVKSRRILDAARG